MVHQICSKVVNKINWLIFVWKVIENVSYLFFLLFEGDIALK